MAKLKKAKKGGVEVSSRGYIYVHASFNNIIITMTNHRKETVAWSSAGKMGFKGSKKNTPYAGQCTGSDVAKTAYMRGLRHADVFIKGVGMGIEAAIKAVGAEGVEISKITDLTPVPHNGCRPPKQRTP